MPLVLPTGLLQHNYTLTGKTSNNGQQGKKSKKLSPCLQSKGQVESEGGMYPATCRPCEVPGPLYIRSLLPVGVSTFQSYKVTTVLPLIISYGLAHIQRPYSRETMHSALNL